MRWSTANRDLITFQEICNNISYIASQKHDHTIVVGADSQPITNGTILVVAICILSDCPGFERKFYYGRYKKEKFYDLYSRVAAETQLSINIATKLRDYTHLTNADLNISVHLDISSNLAKQKTSKYSNGLINLVKAYDINDVEVKPNSWAASCVADKYTKIHPAKLEKWLKACTN